MDDSTKKPISKAIVEMKGSDGTVVYDTTKVDGLYHFNKLQVKQKTTYNLTVKKDKYMSVDKKSKAEVTTIGEELSKDLKQDLALVPIPKKPVVLPDILFDLAKWDLKPQFQDSLNGLYSTLVENDNFTIELSSHTDSRGSVESNDTLSNKRAGSCYDYLVSKGIAADRMTFVGKGKHEPRVLDKDKVVIYNGKPYSFTKGTILNDDFIIALKSKDEQEAAHSLNRRTEFKITGDKYIPKETNKKVAPVKADIKKDGPGVDVKNK